MYPFFKSIPLNFPGGQQPFFGGASYRTGFRPPRTADFRDSNNNGIDDRDEGQTTTQRPFNPSKPRPVGEVAMNTVQERFGEYGFNEDIMKFLGQNIQKGYTDGGLNITYDPTNQMFAVGSGGLGGQGPATNYSIEDFTNKFVSPSGTGNNASPSTSGGIDSIIPRDPGYGTGFNPPMGGGFNPFMGGGFNPFMGGGFNPYFSGYGGGNPFMGGGFNPYMGGGFNPFMGGGYNPFMGGIMGLSR